MSKGVTWSCFRKTALGEQTGREPGGKKGPRKTSAAPKRGGGRAASWASGHPRGTREDLISDRAECDAIWPHVFLIKIKGNKAHPFFFQKHD